MATFFAFVPLLGADRGLRISEVGILITVYLLIASLLQRPFGKLADRRRKVTLLLVGNLVKMSGLALLPLAGGPVTLFLPILAMALGTGLGIPASTGLAAILGKRHDGTGSIIGLMQTAMSVGFFTGAIVAGAIVDLAGESAAFPCVAAVVLILTMGIPRLLGSKEERYRTDGGGSVIEAEARPGG
jgi:predicted MFS family arabinose efflux permease